MRQNVYDDPEFFAGYRQMRDDGQGLNDAVVRPSLDRLLPPLAGKRVLDLGCGEGWLCRFAADAGAATVVGVDPSSRMLEDDSWVEWFAWAINRLDGNGWTIEREVSLEVPDGRPEVNRVASSELEEVTISNSLTFARLLPGLIEEMVALPVPERPAS